MPLSNILISNAFRFLLWLKKEKVLEQKNGYLEKYEVNNLRVIESMF